MIRQLIAVTVKELKVLWHDREALALLFAMPVFFILVMSLALEGVFEAGSRERPIEILLVDEDRGEEAEKVLLDLARMERLTIIRSLDGQPVTLATTRAMIAKKKYRLALHFRAHFSERILSGAGEDQSMPPAIAMIFDPTMNIQLLSSLEGTIRGVVERRALLARLPGLIGRRLSRAAEEGQPEFGAAMGELKPRLERMLSDAVADLPEPATSPIQLVALRDVAGARRPTSTEQNVPGYTIFGVFFIVLTLASSFIAEKEVGTFRRLLAAPLSKAALIAGKLLPYFIVNLIQIALMFAVGVVFFDLRLGNVPALLLISLALSAAANGLGLLVATIGKTEAQVNGLAVLLAITLSALGGMMVPAFVMPGFMKTLSQFTPHAWALAGYHDVIIRGTGVRGVIGEAGVLTGFSILFFLIALWRFRFD